MSLQRKNFTPLRTGEQRIISSSRVSDGSDERFAAAGYVNSQTLTSLPPSRTDQIDATRMGSRRQQRQMFPQSNTSYSDATVMSQDQYLTRTTNDGVSSVSGSGMARSVYEHEENVGRDRRTTQSYSLTLPFAASSTSSGAGMISRGNSSTKQFETGRMINSSENGDGKHRPRAMYLMRHGERCDFALGRSWLEYLGVAFGKPGSNRQTARRPNLNIPAYIPNRPALELAKDPPLTEIGLFQARKTGIALAEAGVRIRHVYSSPALRCIQTAVEVLRGLLQGGSINGVEPCIRIEPGLFEWCGWYKAGMPIFMSVDQLLAFDSTYPLDATYRAFFDPRNYDVSESTEEYFRRSADTVDAVVAHATSLSSSEAGFSRGGSTRPAISAVANDLLLIGHAGSLYTCTRRLTGRADSRGQNFVKHFKELAAKVPYCGLCAIEESQSVGSSSQGKWRLVEPPCATFVHSANAPFDWRILV